MYTVIVFIYILVIRCKAPKKQDPDISIVAKPER